ncbi:apyrase family protein [Naegleria gruberi]|uniref:Apyrase family protein n=1 Tax=Naegleria gruberi TaxID=5762 RepID=D2VBB5_NAEGR|nr:apyrase family protein [Naegleria gruberi]EFC45878.1 apyrase family protein [Naegleria gruberi]|eukprot:XP_002678622.1 apyrase family protein [Naegleria gruberi strain NEG-M]
MHKRTFSTQSLTNLLSEEHNNHSHPLANLSINIPTNTTTTITSPLNIATSSSIIQSPIIYQTNSNFSSEESLTEMLSSDLENGQANNTGSKSSTSSLFAFVLKNKRILYPVFIALVLITLGITVVAFYSSNPDSTLNVNQLSSSSDASTLFGKVPKSSISSQQSSRLEFPILLVADRDKASKVTDDKKGTQWKSVLLKGLLKRNEQTGAYSVSFNEKPWEINGLLVEGSRGMELSELKMFNGKLYSADDRTGIVYQLITSKGSDGNVQVRAIARHILPDGNGETTAKGFKCEWATVKDNKLYIGSIGKEWTTGEGKILNHDPMYIKTIDNRGHVEHVNWVSNYKKMLRAVGIKTTGYMVHEAAEWSDFHKRWFFLPRRVSFETYDEKKDEQRGSNHVISASEDFSDITVTKIGEIISPARGFSSVKFIPGRPNEIVAVKSEETDDAIRSYIMVFDIATNKILLPETKIIDEKIEGLEIA